MLKRQEIENRLADFLARRKEILFAYVFGSFTEPGVPFRDVDVGVFIQPSAAKELNQLAYEANLGLELSHEIGTEVDVHVINNASVGFAHSVLRGRKLFSRDDLFLSNYIERISQEWCDFEHLFHEGLRDILHWDSQT